MRFLAGVLVAAVAQCGPSTTAGTNHGSAPGPRQHDNLVAPLFVEQPASVCEGWSPAPEPDLMEARQLVARGQHACVRVSSGRVRCWGSNATGQLGSCEDIPHSAIPQTFPGVETARDVAVGRHGTCVLDDDGALFCSSDVRAWMGAVGPGKIEGTGIATAVAVGDLHACVLQSSERILCFGRWDAAEALGPRAQLAPDDDERGAGFIDLQRPTQIVAGASHNCALERQGRVMCWGQNTMGQLGDPDAGIELDPNRGVPRRVGSLPFIESLHAEQNTTCAVSDVGELFCWGEGFGARPLGVGVPKTRHAAMGRNFVCVTTDTGALWCGGDSPAWTQGRTAGVLPGYRDGTGVAVGHDFVCAMRSDGIVQCQGDNTLGQLGGQHRHDPQRLEPTMVLLGGVDI